MRRIENAQFVCEFESVDTDPTLSGISVLDVSGIPIVHFDMQKNQLDVTDRVLALGKRKAIARTPGQTPREIKRAVKAAVKELIDPTPPPVDTTPDNAALKQLVDDLTARVSALENP